MRSSMSCISPTMRIVGTEQLKGHLSHLSTHLLSHTLLIGGQRVLLGMLKTRYTIITQK